MRKPEEAFDIPALRASATNVDKQMVSAAVERYLTQRGVPVVHPVVQPVVKPAGNAKKSNVVADVVDQFLSTKRTPPPAPVVEASPAPAPSVVIVDFVCENDVQAAIRKSQKIYIGPKTIVTPSARDLAAQHDTLVHAKRT